MSPHDFECCSWLRIIKILNRISQLKNYVFLNTLLMYYHTYSLKLNNFLLIHSFLYKTDWDDSVTICDVQTCMFLRAICRSQYLSCFNKIKNQFFRINDIDKSISFARISARIKFCENSCGSFQNVAVFSLLNLVQ